MKRGDMGVLLAVGILFCSALMSQEPAERMRVREMGVEVGVLPVGEHNAITDVDGVLVGHATLRRGDNVRSGVTAILPHGGNLFLEKVPAAVHVGNGFGKLMGTTQVEELGNLETPILLTGTLNVPKVADALLDYMLGLPGMEDVHSVNPLVGETNDSYLNDLRSRPVGREEVFQAIRSASGGAVEEGAVGAGTGTITYGFKGGIGTSSRVLPESMGGWTVGVLVQSNFGGILEIVGTPVGRELGRYYMRNGLERARQDSPDGSCMIVVATDAPLSVRNLKRLARRAMLGLGTTGSPSTNGSGDYVIAFSSHPGLRIPYQGAGETPLERVRQVPQVANRDTSPLFQAVKEATEEAVYNSLFMARTTEGRDGHRIEALPLDKVKEILKRYGRLGKE
ncbi:MAG TPA: P1 family peptidase [Acidobacteriota bacterium]|nr:P1 family peptidase [Acidobacteriota bacterium]